MVVTSITLGMGMNPWWTTSVTINRALGGDRTEPLCSRVYRQRPSAARSTFLRAMDLFFKERDHCLMIHNRWTELRDACGLTAAGQDIAGRIRAGL